MEYPLRDLLRVRKHREESAATQLLSRKGELEQAIWQFEEKRRELDEYVHWRIQEERRMYGEVLSQLVSKDDLEALRTNIEFLKSREEDFQKAVDQAQGEMDGARKAVLEAEEFHKAAVRARQKIEEHRTIWTQQTASEYERNQEKELEDFRVQDSRHES
ncbi:MAG: YscO family type III secretion system apparatus protein [Planctomycetaceae bacterium]|nr:YscO family type III secretion system apparatus protein [Planctomycetaceae bacterium]